VNPPTQQIVSHPDGSVEVLAPAKLNLTLSVRPEPRPDGFHEIESLFVGIDFYDRLMFQPPKGFPSAPEPALTVRGLDAPCDETNLVFQAAKLLAEHVGRPCNVSIHLEKHIPAGRGLGGGSSDAAATLLGLNHLWNLELSRDELAALGARLGSDVPFFFYLPAAECRGRGERVEPVNVEKIFAVLVIPDFAISTPSVYKIFDELTAEGKMDTLTPSSGMGLMPTTPKNQLEPAAMRAEPRLAEVRQKVKELGLGENLHLTGSGSAMFALCEPEQARQAAEKINNRTPWQARVVETCSC